MDVKVSQWSEKYVQVDEHGISLNGGTIDYGDVKTVKWSSVRSTLNFIPYWQSYSFVVSDGVNNIKISMSAPFMIGNRRLRRSFNALAAVGNEYMVPVVAGQAMAALKAGEKIPCGTFDFSHQGVHVLHLKGVETLPWGQVHSANLSGGSFCIFTQNKKGKARLFRSISMGLDNIVALPAIFAECKQLWG